MMMLIFMFSFSTVLSCIIVFILMIQWLPSSHIKYVKINNTKHSKINIKINISLFEHRVPPYLHGSKPHVSSQIHQFGGVIRHIQRHQSSDCWQVISHNHYIYIYTYIMTYITLYYFQSYPIMSFYFLPPTDVGEIHRPCLDMFGSSPQLRSASRSSWASSWTGAPLKMQSQYVSQHCSQSMLHTYIAYISVFFIWCTVLYFLDR